MGSKGFTLEASDFELEETPDLERKALSHNQSFQASLYLTPPEQNLDHEERTTQPIVPGIIPQYWKRILDWDNPKYGQCRALIKSVTLYGKAELDLFLDTVAKRFGLDPSAPEKIKKARRKEPRKASSPVPSQLAETPKASTPTSSWNVPYSPLISEAGKRAIKASISTFETIQVKRNNLLGTLEAKRRVTTEFEHPKLAPIVDTSIGRSVASCTDEGDNSDEDFECRSVTSEPLWQANPFAELNPKEDGVVATKVYPHFILRRGALRDSIETSPLALDSFDNNDLGSIGSTDFLVIDVLPKSVGTSEQNNFSAVAELLNCTTEAATGVVCLNANAMFDASLDDGLNADGVKGAFINVVCSADLQQRNATVNCLTNLVSIPLNVTTCNLREARYAGVANSGTDSGTDSATIVNVPTTNNSTLEELRQKTVVTQDRTYHKREMGAATHFSTGNRRITDKLQMKVILNVPRDVYKFTADKVADVVDEWKAMLIGVLNGDRLSMQSMVSFAENHWKVIQPKIFLQDNGVWVFKFHSIEDSLWVLENGPWLVNGFKPLILKT